MKKLFAFLCAALIANAASAVETVQNKDAFCTQLSSDIVVQSALFSTLARVMPESSDDTLPAPLDVRQRAHDREVALRDIANEIWSLRARMAYLNCAQARDFAY